MCHLVESRGKAEQRVHIPLSSAVVSSRMAPAGRPLRERALFGGGDDHEFAEAEENEDRSDASNCLFNTRRALRDRCR
jgi:hypothetical protein